MSKLFGYARVSTNQQDLTAQIEAIKVAGVHPSDIYVEKISSRSANRKQLNTVISMLEDGDVLTVYKLDRIGRSLKDLISIVEGINAVGANIKTLSGNQIIDTTTSQGKLFFNLMAIFSEYERDIIRERTLMGLEAAKAKGVQLGRKRLYDPTIKDDIERLRKNLTVAEVCKQLNISKTTYYRYIE